MKTVISLFAGLLGAAAGLAHAGEGSDSYDLVARGR